MHKVLVINIISPESVNLAPSDVIPAIYVIAVDVNVLDYDPRIIDLLNRMKHKAIYAMLYGDRCKLVVFEEMQFQTEWGPADDVQIQLIGLDIGEVWENLVRYVGDLPQNEPFEDSVTKAVFNAGIQKQIDMLENKLAKEKQNHVQREIYAQIQQLKKQLR